MCGLGVTADFLPLVWKSARKRILEDLKSEQLIEKIEPYALPLGRCQRCKTPVEPYLSDQWFIKMAPLAEPALEVVRQGLIRFFPERHAQQLFWIDHPTSLS